MYNVIYLDKEIIESKAFQALRGNSVKLLVYFMTKCAKEKINGKWVITNNGSIVLRYQDAPGMIAATFTHSLDQLVEVGFVDICIPGGKNRPTKYAMQHRWKLYGKPDFVPAKRNKRKSHDNKFKGKLSVIK